jgi:hypothetical protein
VETTCPTCGERTSLAPHAGIEECLHALRGAAESLRRQLAQAENDRARVREDVDEFHAILTRIADAAGTKAAPELIPIVLDQIRETAATCVRLRLARVPKGDTGLPTPPPGSPRLRAAAFSLLEARLPDLRRIAESGPTEKDAPVIQALAHLVLAELHGRLAEEAKTSMNDDLARG